MFYTIVASGELAEDTLSELVAHMQSLGLTVSTQSKVAPIDEPTPADTTPVYDVLKFFHSNPYDQPTLTALIDSAQLTDLASLRKLRLAEFLAPSAGRDLWLVRATLLSYMMRHHLRFRDSVPAAVFVTPVTTVLNEGNPYELRVINALRNNGLLWVELLRTMSEADIRDVRNIGDKAVNLLKQRGVTFQA